MILLQNPSVPTPTNPIEIDAAILDIKTELETGLIWLTNGYGRAYKNLDITNGERVYFPEVYLGKQGNSFRYTNITPDNDKTGQCFFFVRRETVTEYQQGMFNFLNYDVSLIFSVNMELIQSTLIETEIYQQNLVAQVRNVLTRQILGKNYQITINNIEYLFEDVFRDFNLSEQSTIEKSPLSHFRVNLSIVLPETCPVPVLPPNICYSMQFDAVNNYIEASGSTSFDFDINDPFSFTFWHKDYFGLFKPLATKIGGGKGYRFMRDTGGQLLVQFLHSPSQYIYVRTTTATPSSGWHHYAITYDGSGLPSGIKVYFDGVVQPMTTLVNSFPVAGTMITTQNFLIGAQLPTLFVGGNSALMRCWNIELSDINVLAEYNFKLNGNIINPSNLVGSPNIKTSTFDGLDWTFPDIANNSVFKSVNMELGDRVEDCPT